MAVDQYSASVAEAVALGGKIEFGGKVKITKVKAFFFVTIF